jgi:hypothetical protein
MSIQIIISASNTVTKTLGAVDNIVDEEKGKEEVRELDMATQGTCSNKADIHGTAVILENLTN